MTLIGRFEIKTRDVLLALLTAMACAGLFWLLVYINSAKTRARVKAGLESRLSASLNREFRLGEVGFRLPLSITIRGAAVASRDSLSRGALLRVGQAGASVDPIRSLWRRRLIVGGVSLEGAEILLEQDSGGAWNFEDLLKSDTTKPKGRKNFPRVSIPSISLANASVTVRMPGSTERIESVRFQGGLRMGGERLELKINDFGLREPKRGIEVSKASGRFSMAGDTMRLGDLRIKAGGSELEAGLWIDGAGRSFQVSKFGLKLDLADAGRSIAAPAGSYRGMIEMTATGQGTFDDPRGEVRLSGRELTLNQMRVQQLSLEASAKDGRAELRSLNIRSGPGQAVFSGWLDWKKRQYQAKAGIERLDLGTILPANKKGQLKTDINGRLACQGSGFQPERIRASAELFLHHSSFSGVPLDTLDCRLEVADMALSIERFHLRSGQAAMDIRGDIYPRAVSIELETEEIELSQFGPLVGLKDLAGRLRFTGLISGEPKNPDIIATFRLKEAAAAGAECEYLDGSMSMKSMASSPVGDGKFTATGVKAGGQNIDRVAVLIELRGLEWGGFSVVVNKDSLTEANVVGRVEIRKKDFTLVVSKLFYAHGPQMVANSQPVEVVISGPKVSLKPSKFIIGRGVLTAEGEYTAGGAIAARLSARNLDSRRLVELAGLDKTVHGFLDLDLRADGTLAEPDLSLGLSLNTLRYEQFTADRLDLDVKYGQGRVDLKRLDIVRFGQLSEITASAPLNLGLGKDASKLPEGPISGQVVLRDIGTWAFFPMADLLSVWEGRVDVNVKLYGTTSQPLFSGEATVNNGKMVLRPFGMYLHSVQARAHFNADSIVIDNVSALTENNGTVQIRRGEILLEKFLPTTMNFLVFTERSPIRNIPFIEANVNSSIVIGGTVNNPRITGDVTVNSALITMPFAPAEEPPPPEGDVKPLDMSLNITGSREIWLRNKDADIELAIENLNVRLQQNLLFLSGRLSTIQGVYRFLDRSFDITSGQLTFTNAVLIDPQLNLTAQTTITRAEEDESKQYLITLSVRGTALQPKLSFSSDPSMSEGDILAMLGAGMRADELRDIDLGSQASRGLDYALSIATGRVQRHTGLDMLKVKTLTGAEKGAQVTIGKYVARRVYVSYTQGFSANLSNEFKAEYIFGPRSALFAQKDDKNTYNLGVRMRFKY
ncbi:MAG TPA: hypothetical protein DDW31_06865 [candidate division Zixibacteria bacterium]|nr:hypothetical protein [candidate division Zixibacteria bacterium]